MNNKRIRLFPNNNQKSLKLAKELTKKLSEYGFILDDIDYEIAIAIGGDGSYLRMLKNTNFNSNIFYIGINMGTLGFLQEIKPQEINSFLDKLANDLYKIDEVGIQETILSTSTTQEHFYSLNEILIRDKDLKTTNLIVKIDNELLEKYTGDGLLIATSIGSTAYNLSLGGSIVYSGLHTLQITPIAPLNTRSYRNILNSIVIPESKVINVIPEDQNKDLMIIVDGENNIYNDVKNIKTSVSKKKIKCLRMKDYDYTKIIKDKFLT